MYGRFHFSNGDRDRLNKAEKELREFAAKWDHGKFDKGQLNDSIESVQKVLNSNKLPAEDRSALDADISQLRRMREAYEHHEIKLNLHLRQKSHCELWRTQGARGWRIHTRNNDVDRAFGIQYF